VDKVSDDDKLPPIITTCGLFNRNVIKGSKKDPDAGELFTRYAN